MHARMHAGKHAYKYTHAHTRTRTHTHTHKHTHTRLSLSHTHTHAYMQAEKATKETIAFMIKYTSAQIQTSQLNRLYIVDILGR